MTALIGVEWSQVVRDLDDLESDAHRLCVEPLHRLHAVALIVVLDEHTTKERSDGM